MMGGDSRTLIRLLAIVEARAVTGPAKNLLQFCSICRDLDAKASVETTIAAFHRGPGDPTLQSLQPDDFTQAVRENGIPLCRIEERFPFDPAVFRQFHTLVDQIRPDIIQTHSVKSHLLVCVSGLWRTTPWVAFHHGYTATDLKMRIYNQFDRWSLSKYPRVATVSFGSRQQLVAHGIRSTIRVFHNAIEPNWLAGVHQEEAWAVVRHNHDNISNTDRVVLAVGRLSKEKAFADLIPAMVKVRDIRPELPVRLIIIGDGPELAKVRRSIFEAGMGDRIILAGHVGQVKPYYRIASLVVIPSHSEGSPNVLLEAMSSGVPVVATAVGGIPEIVQNNETALLVEPRDPNSLAEAIISVLSNAQLANSLTCKAHEVVTNKFSPQVRARSLLEFYQDIVRG